MSELIIYIESWYDESKKVYGMMISIKTATTPRGVEDK